MVKSHPKTVAGLALLSSLASGAALILTGNAIEGVGVITAAFSTGLAAWSRS